MPFELPPSIDAILQQQYDDKLNLHQLNKARPNTWNNRMRQKIHARVERNWIQNQHLYPKSDSLGWYCVIALMGMGVVAALVPWFLKIPVVCAMPIFVYWKVHAHWGIQRMRYKERLETPWGKPTNFVKQIIPDNYQLRHPFGDSEKFETYEKTLLTQAQYVGLLHTLKNALGAINPQARTTGQFLLDRVDGTSAYYATVLAEKLDEEFKVNAWNVVEFNIAQSQTPVARPVTPIGKTDVKI